MYAGKRSTKKNDVSHNWAHQLESKYKKDTIANNLYYEGKTIFSYGSHFPIATIHEDKKRGNVTFFTTRTWGPTTAGHISAVRSACSHHKVILCMNPDDAAKGYHTNNLASFETEAKSAAQNLPKAKKPEKYLSVISYQRDLAKAYADYFKIKLTATKFPYLFIESKDGGNKASAAEIKRAEKLRIQKEKLAQAEFDTVLNGFRTFTNRKGEHTNQIGNVYNPKDGNAAYLRFNKETKRIETSKGVVIPTEIAKRAYKWIKSINKAGGCTGECSYKILDFEVEYVNAKEFKVGCHTIQLTEAETIAKQLNW